MDVSLTYYNKSNDTSNSNIVLLQRNQALGINYQHIAWKVIQNCAIGSSHTFTYPKESQISASDSWGNETRHLCARSGELFNMQKDASGNQLYANGKASSGSEIQLRNDLHVGSISAHIYKNNNLVASVNTVAPEQKATFLFKSTIFCGVVSQVKQGMVLDSAVLTMCNKEISLLGVASADLTLIGGGNTIHSNSFRFLLENVIRV